jgi:lipopolysaccharide transport protein LptA/LPS export ABC transporter protein LptC
VPNDEAVLVAAHLGGLPVPAMINMRAEPQAGALGAAGDRERADAFATARRHSLFVRALRLVLPIAAAGIALVYLAVLTTSWKLGAGRLNVGEVEVTADDLTMKNPSYFGLTDDGGRYIVRAKRAVVELNAQAPIKLLDIDGDLLAANEVATKLKARRGLLDNVNSELELFDGISIDSSNGMHARLSRARIFSKQHRVESQTPVDLTLNAGTVHGASMVMNTATREATLAGDVAVHLHPSSDGAAHFGRDARQPVDVISERLYINDGDDQHLARFTGNVVATQGDAQLKAPKLTVVYEGKASQALVAGGGQTPASRVRRLMSSGGSLVTSGADRRIMSDTADFDAERDTALFVGNVLVRDQKNVLQGRRLFVERTTGKSRLDAPSEANQQPGRIAATFYASERGAQPAAKSKGAAADLAANLQGSVMGSFKTDPNAPIDVDADVLDINDTSKQAVFHGNVKAQQGDFVMRTVELIVHYHGQTGVTASSEVPTTMSQLTRVDAKQKVLITSKDGQSATGDWAIFDVKANTVLLGGNVIVSHGKDIAEGPRLKIDLTSGMYRFELEEEPHAMSAPAVSASEPSATGGAGHALSTETAPRTCAPGKQCLLFFPKDAQDRAKGAVIETGPPAKPADGWQPSTSASPALRGN